MPIKVQGSLISSDMATQLKLFYNDARVALSKNEQVALSIRPRVPICLLIIA